MCGSLAQLVEQRPEEPCVPSSSLGGATKKNFSAELRCFSWLVEPGSNWMRERERTTSSVERRRAQVATATEHDGAEKGEARCLGGATN